tara:strand:+ start:5597 stop:5833 length:237 start_codon:yes stop_codon:yes gene_type:complete
MTNTKTSKLLLLWLFSIGHKVNHYEEAKGITTIYGGKEFRFDISGSYGGYRVVYNHPEFKFYNGDTLIKITDLRQYEI